MTKFHDPFLRRLAYMRRNRCSVLLAALCLFILANPLLSDSPVGLMAASVCLFAIIVVALWALRKHRLIPWSLAALALVVMEAFATDRVAGLAFRVGVQAAIGGFLAVVTVALLAYVLDRRSITNDKVFGAVSAYMLIAFTFASLFKLLQLIEPGAFHVATAGRAGGQLDWAGMMYFSFTVLTSTGFGEITPVTNMARGLVVIEQVMGVMYVAFLIARLANLYGRQEPLD
jgi:hypothetical protein